MAQSGNGAASESDATSLGTGQELNFDGDTQKGKGKGKSVVVSVVIAAKCLQVANGIYLINIVFIRNFYQQSILNNESCCIF